MFHDRLPWAIRYVAWLAEAGVQRGLIGPREAPRLWERHVLNCAALTDVVPHGATVADIGSGAGLPGIVLAIRRPDLTVTLIEPLLRRTTFLSEVVADLGLASVTVRRGRADEVRDATFDVVTSRAVAPLGRLLEWSWPLVAPGGCVLAMKGASATQEIEDAAAVLRRLSPRPPEVLHLTLPGLISPTTVVRVESGIPSP